MNIFIDIETVPSQAADIRIRLAAEIKPPGTLKKAESIAEWERESRPAAVEEAYLKTSFDAASGQVCCIGWAIDDGPAQALVVGSLELDAERDMLASFWATLRDEHGGNHGTRPVFVGHNLAAFDLPFLLRRSIVHQVKPPLWFPCNPKPWSETVADTMAMWAGDRGSISMDRLCNVLGIDGKGDGPTGADVWPMAQAGRWADIASYCAADVQRTRAIFGRLTFANVA